jgi:hypothetical protein
VKNPNFRGIASAVDLQGRCIVDDFTECWHWQGAMRSDKRGLLLPAMWVFDSQKGKYRTMTGPLAVLEIVGRRGLGVRTAWRTCGCGDCVNPQHILGGTKADWGRWIRTTGAWKNVPARVVANRRSARARSETGREIVAAVCSSPLNGRQAAAEFGISPQQVSKYRTGRSWVDPVVAGASVFSLGAR